MIHRYLFPTTRSDRTRLAVAYSNYITSERHN